MPKILLSTVLSSLSRRTAHGAATRPQIAARRLRTPLARLVTGNGFKPRQSLTSTRPTRLNGLGALLLAAGLGAVVALGAVAPMSHAGAQDATTTPSPARTMPRVIITEIMYDPASDERRNQTEWVEIANLSGETVTIVDWRLDDEDIRPADQWGPFSCVLLPGQVAVLINGDEVTEEEFRAAWDDSESEQAIPYLVIPVKWGSLANNPSATNEILVLRDGEGNVVCEVNFESGNGWPRLTGRGGPSIYLTDLDAVDLNDGSLWRASVDGEDGARQVRPTPIFDGPDIGSPGRLPPRRPAKTEATTARERASSS